MATPPLLSNTLEQYLQVASSREQVIAANMANIDTPGYHTKDMNFAREMQRAANADLSGEDGVALEPQIEEVRNLNERPDGNNVNLDREGLMLAQAQLQYQMGVQLVKSQFHQLLSAIKGGE
jgi:flagellar basal-body rod protein FlgB